LKSDRENKFDSINCPCPKKSACPRSQNCDECKRYHYDKNTMPYCERDINDIKAK